jgi:hypothetical protein
MGSKDGSEYRARQRDRERRRRRTRPAAAPTRRAPADGCPHKAFRRRGLQLLGRSTRLHQPRLPRSPPQRGPCEAHFVTAAQPPDGPARSPDNLPGFAPRRPASMQLRTAFRGCAPRRCRASRCGSSPAAPSALPARIPRSDAAGRVTHTAGSPKNVSCAALQMAPRGNGQGRWPSPVTSVRRETPPPAGSLRTPCSSNCSISSTAAAPSCRPSDV